MPQSSLPVAVIGAGPVGLAAAAHLVSRGERPIVLEAGPTVGASIRQWAHVRTFSPWKYNVDAVAREMLEATGWQLEAPDEAPTGADLARDYLEPLAALPAIRAGLRLGARVTGITRSGYDKMRTPGREEAPFALRVAYARGREETVFARAVIDATGTYQTPNPLGASGMPAIGEEAAATRIFYGIPDVLDRDRARYAGKRVLVVGGGHSAFNALIDLSVLQQQAPGTTITWATRSGPAANMFGGGTADALPRRGALGLAMQELVDSGRVAWETGFPVTEVRQEGEAVTVLSGQLAIGPFDEIVCATGFRPDLSLTRELRVELDPTVEAPPLLAPLIDPNVHSCGTVPPHGERELAHPENGFYTVGMKSYGRAPTFLMLTGYEQVRSVVAQLVGDSEGARNVMLELPQTGVCSTGGSEDAVTEAASACCGPAPAAVVSIDQVDASAARNGTLAATTAEPVAVGSGCRA